jgi:hypothetical protein
MQRLTLIALLLALKIAPVFGQTAWQFRTEKDGIKIYSSIMPGSKIKAIRVISTYEATPAQIVSIVMDVNTATEWVSHLKSSVLIKQVSPSELYYYSEVALPWPAANRDFVAHLIASQDPKTKIVTIDGPAVPGFVPEKKGIVRINNSVGKWIITPLDEEHVRVDYTIHVDPGGSLPSWLVNMFATEAPMQIFENLKKELKKPDYKNIALAFIQ